MSCRDPLDLGRLQGPLLIFGGPYSNLPATAAMQAVAEQRRIPPQNVICTGDLVAYCAEPEATVNLVRDWGIHVVMGNCEEALASGADDCGCGFEEGSSCSALSAAWYRYADSLISETSRSWMGRLPRQLRFEISGRRLAAVHGGVEQINRFLFASTPVEQKWAELDLLGSAVVGLVSGHCGIPFGERIGEKVWLNAGVIGMPANDGSRDGWYLLLQPVDDRLRASWHRLRYPAAEAHTAMLEAGLSGYAEAMTSGLWPSEDVLPETEKRARGTTLELPPLEF